MHMRIEGRLLQGEKEEFRSFTSSGYRYKKLGNFGTNA